MPSCDCINDRPQAVVILVLVVHRHLITGVPHQRRLVLRAAVYALDERGECMPRGVRRPLRWPLYAARL